MHFEGVAGGMNEKGEAHHLVQFADIGLPVGGTRVLMLVQDGGVRQVHNSLRGCMQGNDRARTTDLRSCWVDAAGSR